MQLKTKPLTLRNVQADNYRTSDWLVQFSYGETKLMYICLDPCKKPISNVLKIHVKSTTHCCTRTASLWICSLFLPHFDVICDLLLNRRMATINRVNYHSKTPKIGRHFVNKGTLLRYSLSITE